MGMARCIINRFLVPSVLMAVGLAGCSLDDDRDLCCPETLTMHYTYRPYGAEAFGENILSLRHFLFDTDGLFLGELPAGEDLRRQPLNLPEGTYTMVTVGNMSERSAHRHGDDRLLGQFSLSHEALHDGEIPGLFANTDELFWGVKRFAVDTDGRGTELTAGRSAEPANRLQTPMNNIHCHLRVKVEWANMPPYVGDYTLELDGVATAYSLDPDVSSDAGGFIVPQGSRNGIHRLQIPLKSRELDAEFITLRYSDNAVPTLRILFGSDQVSPDIDLGKAFTSWGWRPSATHVQDYTLLIRLLSNGNADLFPRIEASVTDWINGGTFG